MLNKVDSKDCCQCKIVSSKLGHFNDVINRLRCFDDVITRRKILAMRVLNALKQTGSTKHLKGLKRRKGATKDLLNTANYDKGLQIDLLNTAKND